MKISATITVEVDSSKYDYVDDSELKTQKAKMDFVRNALLWGDLDADNIKEVTVSNAGS